MCEQYARQLVLCEIVELREEGGIIASAELIGIPSVDVCKIVNVKASPGALWDSGGYCVWYPASLLPVCFLTVSLQRELCSLSLAGSRALVAGRKYTLSQCAGQDYTMQANIKRGLRCFSLSVQYCTCCPLGH